MLDLVIFLGNPGAQYRRNRHNVGWLFAEALPFYPALSWQDKYKGRYAALDSGRLRGAAYPGVLKGSDHARQPSRARH
jgi:PTH1 family peptidyl-tRNA hydrolase